MIYPDGEVLLWGGKEVGPYSSQLKYSCSLLKRCPLQFSSWDKFCISDPRQSTRRKKYYSVFQAQHNFKQENMYHPLIIILGSLKKLMLLENLPQVLYHRDYQN